jgi:hypothetical protein
MSDSDHTKTPVDRRPVKRGQYARFVVSVDRQIKSSFDSRVEAQAEADRLSAKFANLTIAVNDLQEPLIRESAGEPESLETASAQDQA